MADELPDHRLEHPEVRFEPTDISLRGVLAVIVVFALFVPVHQFLTVKLFNFDRRHPQPSTEAGAPAVEQGERLPREPRLEQVDRLAGVHAPDVYRREQSKEAILHSYGPTKEQGYVHVPIHWAIGQAVEQLKSQTENSKKPVHHRGLIDAGEPNSGRMFRGEAKP